ncbi:MAG TPA: DUF177 domain-containing protein [Streptosporangiaceae bacterium]|jgi:uncharacterized protein
MSHLIRNSITHPNPRSPLVFDTRALGRQPGTERSETRLVPAPEHLHVALACVPAGAEVTLDVRLEAVSEGVLVTAEAVAPVAGECARCLEPVTSTVEVGFRELYLYELAADRAAGECEDADRRFLDGDLLDLEPAFRDAVVLALPLAPLCREDCEGLCPECGVRLAAAGPEHGHDTAPDPRWARLRQLGTGESGQPGARAADRQES